MAGPPTKGLELARALVAFQVNNVAAGGLAGGLSLVTPPHLARQTEEPLYPANPYIMCPRLRLQMVQVDEQPGPPAAGMVSGATYRGSWFYYRRQVPGEAHQDIIWQDLEYFRNPYLRETFTPSLIAVPGLVIYSCIPSPATANTVMRHSTNDPNLNVSVGQFDIVITGEITNCS